MVSITDKVYKWESHMIYLSWGTANSLCCVKQKLVLWKYQSKARLFVWVCCRQLYVKKKIMFWENKALCAYIVISELVNVWLLTCFTRKGLASFYKRSRSIEQGFIYISKVSNSPEIFFFNLWNRYCLKARMSMQI